MTAPNIITIGRILAVPLTVWLLVSGHYDLAFLIFVLAGVSDAVDGYISKRFGMATALGSYLDPLADKLLVVSIYITLGFQQLLPPLLVIIVVSRDILIVGAVILSWLMDRPLTMQPLMVSRVNTAAQFLLAGAVLAVLGFGYTLKPLVDWGSVVVGALTVTSGALYMRDWFRHMANGNGASAK